MLKIKQIITENYFLPKEITLFGKMVGTMKMNFGLAPAGPGPDRTREEWLPTARR